MYQVHHLRGRKGYDLPTQIMKLSLEEKTPFMNISYILDWGTLVPCLPFKDEWHFDVKQVAVAIDLWDLDVERRYLEI